MDESTIARLTSSHDLLLDCSLPIDLHEQDDDLFLMDRIQERIFHVLKASAAGDGRIVINSQTLFAVCSILCERGVSRNAVLVSILQKLRKWRILPLDSDQRAPEALADVLASLADPTVVNESPKGLRVRWMRVETPLPSRDRHAHGTRNDHKRPQLDTLLEDIASGVSALSYHPPRESPQQQPSRTQNSDPPLADYAPTTDRRSLSSSSVVNQASAPRLPRRKGAVYTPGYPRKLENTAASSSRPNENTRPTTSSLSLRTSRSFARPSTAARITKRNQPTNRQATASLAPRFPPSIPPPFFIPRTPVKRRTVITTAGSSQSRVALLIQHSPTKPTHGMPVGSLQSPSNTPAKQTPNNALAFHPIPADPSTRQAATPSKKDSMHDTSSSSLGSTRADRSYYSSDGSPLVKDPGHVAYEDRGETGSDGEGERGGDAERRRRLKMLEGFGWRLPH